MTSIYNAMCNQYVEDYMNRISEKVRCQQYKEHSYDSDWDLFFHCDVSGLNHSHFTLTFNSNCPHERREEVLNTVITTMKECGCTWVEDDEVLVTITYVSFLDKDRIRKEAEEIAPTLIGRLVHYMPKEWSCFGIINSDGTPLPKEEGYVREFNGRYCFMKKRARTRVWWLNSEDILRIYWDLIEVD